MLKKSLCNIHVLFFMLLLTPVLARASEKIKDPNTNNDIRGQADTKQGHDEKSKKNERVFTIATIYGIPQSNETMAMLRERIKYYESDANLIAPKKIDEFVNSIEKIKDTQIIHLPKSIEIKDEEAKKMGFNYLKLNTNEKIEPGKKAVSLDIEFECSCINSEKDKTRIAKMCTVPIDYTIILTGDNPCDGRMMLLLLRPQLREKLGVKGSNEGEFKDSNGDKFMQPEQATKAMLKTLHNAVLRFKNDTGRFPTEEEGLRALVMQPTGVKNYAKDGYLQTKELPKDGWNNDFIYQLNPQSGKPFWIISLGADNKFGGEGINRDLYSTDP